MLTAGLGVDIARKFHLEQKAQDVADSAAIAGARMLPDVNRARTTVITYIQQAAGTGYVPWDSDIQVVVDVPNNSGTVGVLVTGAWDPIIMPSWLLGSPTYGVARHAIADMNWDTTRSFGMNRDTAGSGIFGPWAIFVGDTSVSSAMNGNSIMLNGNSHFNDTVALSNHVQNVANGTFEAAAWTGTGGGITPTTGQYIEPPTLKQDELVWDVVLDKNNPADITRYSGAGAPLLGANNQPVRDAAGNTINCRWDGTQFVIEAGNSTVSAGTSGQTAAWGAGIDINIIGAASFRLPYGSAGGGQCYWLGSIQTSERLLVTSNNSEIRTTKTSNGVPGKDNIGLGLSPGYTLGPNQIGLDNGGNALDIYGLVITPARVEWTGQMNNYNAGYEGTAGNYDCVGNGFIKGSLICGSLNSTGNNFKVYYDAGMQGGIPLNNPNYPSPIRYSTPTVWLRK
jgi:hypothetical protein